MEHGKAACAFRHEISPEPKMEHGTSRSMHIYLGLLLYVYTFNTYT